MDWGGGEATPAESGMRRGPLRAGVFIGYWGGHSFISATHFQSGEKFWMSGIEGKADVIRQMRNRCELRGSVRRELPLSDHKIVLIRGGTRPTVAIHNGLCDANALSATVVGKWR